MNPIHKQLGPLIVGAALSQGAAHLVSTSLPQEMAQTPITNTVPLFERPIPSPLKSIPFVPVPAMILMASLSGGSSNRSFWNPVRTSKGLAERVRLHDDLDALNRLFEQYENNRGEIGPLLNELAGQKPELFAESRRGIRFIADIHHPEKARLLKETWGAVTSLPKDSPSREKGLADLAHAIRTWVLETTLSNEDRTILLAYSDLSSEALANAPVELVGKILSVLPDLSDPKAKALGESLCARGSFKHFPPSLWRHPRPTELRRSALRSLFHVSRHDMDFFEKAFPGWDDPAVHPMNRAALATVLEETKWEYGFRDSAVAFLAHVRLHKAGLDGTIGSLPTSVLVEELCSFPELLERDIRRKVEDVLLKRPDASITDLWLAGQTEVALRLLAKRSKRIERVEKEGDHLKVTALPEKGSNFDTLFPDWFAAENLERNLRLLARLLRKSDLPDSEFQALETLAGSHPGFGLENPSKSLFDEFFPWLIPYQGPIHGAEARDFVLRHVSTLIDLHELLAGDLDRMPPDPLLSANVLRLDGEENLPLAVHIGALLRSSKRSFLTKWIARYSARPGDRLGALQALYLVPPNKDHSHFAFVVAALGEKGDDRRYYEGGRIEVTDTESEEEGSFQVSTLADSMTLDTIARKPPLRNRMIADVRRVLRLDEPF